MPVVQLFPDENLQTARAVIRAPDGIYSDPMVLDACAYLLEHGDHVDAEQAKAVRRAIVDRLRERRKAELMGENDPPDSAPVLTVIFFGAAFIALCVGFELVMRFL